MFQGKVICSPRGKILRPLLVLVQVLFYALHIPPYPTPFPGYLHPPIHPGVRNDVDGQQRQE